MKKKTILIVEDEAIVAADLARKLDRLGYQIAGIAAIGDQAIEMAGRLRPDLVLMDIQLNGQSDGITAAEAIRNQFDLPVVYLTALSDAETLARAKLTGPFGYILKPLDERDLAIQIEMALYKQESDRQLREGDRRTKEILESITDAFYALDADWHLTYVNRKTQELWGRPLEELVGTGLWSLFPNYERTDIYREHMRAMQTRKPVHYETISPKLKIWIEANIYPTADGGLSVYFRDISDRKKAEEALRESNQELNEYAYALTHNLKAPFRAVQNYTQFLSEDLADTLEGDSKQYLEGIKKAIIQATDQFKDLESLYRVRNYPIDSEAFELTELLHEMQTIFQSNSKKELIVAPKLPVLNCCKFLIRQILLNLIDNGFKYNQSNAKKVEAGLLPGADNRFEIFVRDNGIGIDPKYHTHIFGIFKRLHTEREYEGTGVGLAIALRAAKHMEGEIRVESAIGKGSTFYVDLPGSIMKNTDNQIHDR